MSRRISNEHRAFAKAQRSRISAAERAIWEVVRAGRLNGWKFKRQAPLGIYVADFICFEARLIVEADGPLHELDDARRHDARRDAWLRGQGFRILRLPNDPVLGSSGMAFQRIVDALTASTDR